jgi:hypothetical protein
MYFCPAGATDAVTRRPDPPPRESALPVCHQRTTRHADSGQPPSDSELECVSSACPVCVEPAAAGLDAHAIARSARCHDNARVQCTIPLLTQP